MEGFYETWLVVEGALEETNQFADTTRGRLAKATWIGDIEREANGTMNVTFEVFELFHGHAPVGDCECHQYVTDHHPKHVFGKVQV